MLHNNNNYYKKTLKLNYGQAIHNKQVIYFDDRLTESYSAKTAIRQHNKIS